MRPVQTAKNLMAHTQTEMSHKQKSSHNININTNSIAENNANKKETSAYTFFHDYMISTIKRKYIRECDSKNIRFVDKKANNYHGLKQDAERTGHIGDSPYLFPFNKNNVTSFIVEELNKPFDVSLDQIAAFNKEFVERFPFNYIPMYINEPNNNGKKNLLEMSQDNEESEIDKDKPDLNFIQNTFSSVTEKFDPKDIQRLKDLVGSDEVRRLSGL